MVVVLFSSVGWIFDPQIDQLVSKSMQENMLSNRYGGTIKSLGDKEKIATCIPSKTIMECAKLVAWFQICKVQLIISTGLTNP